MNKHPYLKPLNSRGVILITVLIVGMIVTFVGMSLADLAMAQYRRTSTNVFHANAMLAAEAGVERSLYELNHNNSFIGYETEEEFFNNNDQGRGTYLTKITKGVGEEKVITSTGKVYRSGANGDLVSTRKIRVTIVGTTSNDYSVYAGAGGLLLNGSANVTNSKIYVNGRINMGGASKIGTQSNPVEVNVANIACPTGTNPGSTYPRVCDSGNAITTAWSPTIYGTVCATGQTALSGPNPNGNIFPGNGGEGLIPGCIAEPLSMPTYNRTDHISRMTTSDIGTSNTYTCRSWPFNRTWSEDLSLSGNVSIDGSCNVTISGDAYISGNLTIGGAAKITVSEDVGATRPVIVVDGKITIGGSARMFENSQGTGIHFISYKSAAACESACTDITGIPLYTSQNTETINIGGAVNLPGMIFQAYWGKIRIQGSGNVGSAIGQTVDLSGAGNITFGTTLSSGNTTWTIRSYQQFFEP